MTETTTDKSQTEPNPTFGSVLRHAREERQLPLAALANATKIAPTALNALEAADLDALPPEVFVRGFIRSYARVVGISDLEPMRLFDRLVHERKAERAAALALAQPPAPPSRHARAVADTRPRWNDHTPGSAGAPAPTAVRELPSADLPYPIFPEDEDGQVSRRGYGIAVFVVIVLLIATLTLSYFIKQPAPSGEGLSWRMRPSPAALVARSRSDVPSRV